MIPSVLDQNVLGTHQSSGFERTVKQTVYMTVSDPNTLDAVVTQTVEDPSLIMLVVLVVKHNAERRFCKQERIKYAAIVNVADESQPQPRVGTLISHSADNFLY